MNKFHPRTSMIMAQMISLKPTYLAVNHESKREENSKYAAKVGVGRDELLILADLENISDKNWPKIFVKNEIKSENLSNFFGSTVERSRYTDMNLKTGVIEKFH